MRWSFATIVLVPRGGPFTPPSSSERRHILAWAKTTGFSGIEVADAWLDFHALDDRSLREFRTEVIGAGLCVSGLNLPRCLFTRGPNAAAEFSRVERAIPIAASLAADVVNISLSLPLPLNGDGIRAPMLGSAASAEEHERAAELVDRLAQRARNAGVSLVVELHDDGLLDTPELCLQLLARLRQPGVGVNPDVANLCRGSGPLPDWRRAFEVLAPHTANWHVKNYCHGQPAPVANGDIDYAVAGEIMRAAGYDGWVSIESRFGGVLAEQRSALGFLQSLAKPAVTHLFR